jgi:hypothetical protein
MILATHNSLSYLKPQWWLRPFAWVGRCQSLTIEQQLEYGVRYFDIRLKFNEGNWIAESGHGLLTYVCNIYLIFDLIDRHSSCIVRMTLENKKASGDMKDNFRAYCKECQSIFANTTFVGGYQKGTWEHIYDFGNDIPVCERYWTYNKGQRFPFPKLYAWLNNKRYKDIGTDTYLMLDYVQL